MTENRYYTGIDKMRFAAALLVIAIHTSPLDSFSETGNFIRRVSLGVLRYRFSL